MKMIKDTIPKAIKLFCLFFLTSWETSNNTHITKHEPKDRNKSRSSREEQLRLQIKE